MVNKKGQEMSIGTLLLLVLGVVVVVVVILGFSLGWNTIFAKLGFVPSQLQSLAVACPGYATAGFSIDYCKFREISTATYANCEHPEVQATAKFTSSKPSCSPTAAQSFCGNLTGNARTIKINNVDSSCPPAA